jgi:hypothetical protein
VGCDACRPMDCSIQAALAEHKHRKEHTDDAGRREMEASCVQQETGCDGVEPSMLLLPTELIVAVLACGKLDTSDFESIRQACRSLYGISKHPSVCRALEEARRQRHIRQMYAVFSRYGIQKVDVKKLVDGGKR